MKAVVSVMQRNGDDEEITLSSTTMELPDGLNTGMLADEMTESMYEEIFTALDPKFKEVNARELALVELRVWVDITPISVPELDQRQFAKVAARTAIEQLTKSGDSLENAIAGYFGK